MKGLLALGAAGALALGCDWRDFDTLQNQVPVLRVDPPSGFPSSTDFGSALVAVAPPTDGSTAAWFLASGIETLGVALVKVDSSGQSSGQTLTGQAIESLSGDPVTAMAEIPGTGTALLGAPTAGALLTVDMATATPSTVSAVATEELFGNGVAAGNLTGGSGPDLVATSDSSIHVFVGGSTSNALSPSSADLTACPIGLPTSLANNLRATRAVVIGKLLGSGSVVAVGTPGAGVAGSVSFFTATASAVTCVGSVPAPALSPASTVNAGFGAALAIADFDGDGVPDLLVGAPPNGAYLYRGPLSLPTPAAPVMIMPPPGNASFGAAVAAANLDGAAGSQALVGDPGATVNGQTGAGNVTIYTWSKATSTLTPTSPVLADHDSNAGESYGTAVAALPFCASAPCVTPTPLPLVGAPARAFIYFTLGPTDPRTM